MGKATGAGEAKPRLARSRAKEKGEEAERKELRMATRMALLAIGRARVREGPATVAGIVGRCARSALSGFLAYNQALSARIEPHLPHAEPKISPLYAETVASYLASEGNQLVVDVGGGRKCHFARYKRSGANTRIIAVDISGDQLRQNRDVDDKILADATSSLPFDDAQVDLIASRFLLGHLRMIDGLVRDSARALKPGGHSIHAFPSKFAPYALINRALPDEFAKRLLRILRPNTKDGCGFPPTTTGATTRPSRSFSRRTVWR